LETLHLPKPESKHFHFPPPPLKSRKQKASKDCYLSFIDEIQGGDYGGAILVRKEPRTHRDIYFTVRTRTTSVLSRRRNSTHVGMPLYRTKAGGPKRSNIEYMTCSFVELDGSTDSTIKTKEDVQALINKNSLPEESYTIGTSRGNFHLLWNYSDPLPWTPKNESYWLAQQTRLIQLFEQGGFLVDKGASMNPTQNLRNPSQLRPYNYKRRCEVFIHKTFKKTSLRAIYRALNKTSIPNPRPIRASVKLRRFLRENETFTLTHAELAINLGVSPRTSKREIKKAIANGDIKIIARLGNNNSKPRTTQYESLIFIEQFPEVPLSSIKTILSDSRALLTRFKLVGAKKGCRNKTIFALGLILKAQLGKRACIEAIRAELLEGARTCLVREKEFERTLQNVMKSSYTNPCSISKLREWDLIQGAEH